MSITHPRDTALDVAARKMAATAPVDEFNPFSPEFVQCPYPFYARLVKEAPVWKAPIQGFYLITGYEEVMEACRHPEIFSSDYRHLFNRKPEIQAILVEQLGVDASEVVETASFSEDLNADSLEIGRAHV